jgi:alkanesulfonate monooxygenase SsuD/methylene tetrahydromethanopterin reductase-like flavin-dependent oxidoreductase (luciferase family)
MEFGVISLSDIQVGATTGGHPYERRTHDIVDYGVLADQSGLDVFALGEHHTLDFAVSSPAVVLAAIAARTSRIRLTSGVTVLPVLDPVRLYQDFASLDLVSNARAEMTVGRSAFTEPFDIFGVDIADYDAVFEEKLDLLLRLRTRDHITWSGRFRTPLHDAALTPRPKQDPLPVWVGVGGSLDSAARAGRLGLPMTLGYIGGPLSHARRAVDVYRAAGEKAGHTADLKVGISTHFYAASSAQTAYETFPYYHEYLRPKSIGGRGMFVSREQFAEGMRRGNAIMIGTTEQLVEKILDAHESLGLDRFLGQIDWGGLPRGAVEESIARYAEEIAPTVRAATGATSTSTIQQN